MAFRMRSSKFRHVFGAPAKKEQCYECIKITKNAHDSTFCAVNPKFLAIVTESAGGGAFLVLPLERVGRTDINAPKVCGHSGPVLDIRWNPFDDHIIASCSDDATVKVWQIPEHGLRSNLTEWLVDLHGHQRRVGFIEWHPTAENILLSAGYDFQCILWNTETAEPINIINVHSDTIFSISWNRDGSLFASTSKDKKIRIIDPREGTVVAEGPGHQGSKASKVVFLGDRNMLFTTGFSRMSERQYGIWDVKKLKEPLKMETVDSSSGVLFPFYDYDTRVVFVAGKGDGNIRYYELTDQPPYVYYLNQYQSSSPQRGLGIMPKRGVDCGKCEIVRFYKLHTIKALCEPVAMIVPRKSEMFQEDIFIPTASATPSLTADQWISGMNREPILVSLKTGAMEPAPPATSVPPKTPVSKPAAKKSNVTKATTNTNSPKKVNSNNTTVTKPLPVTHAVNKLTWISTNSKPVQNNSSSKLTFKTSTSSLIRGPIPYSSSPSKVTVVCATKTLPRSSSAPKATVVSLTRSSSVPIFKPATSSLSAVVVPTISTSIKQPTVISCIRGDDTAQKDGAVSNVPTITTYKAIKRGTSSITTTTTTSPDPRQKRQATTPPMATVAPVSPNKLPQSLRNIRKLSSSLNDDPIESLRESKENINDVINNFERRTNVITKSTTQRLTNANEPLRVDKKVWSSSYTGMNDNENNVTTNGVPRTDPEPMSPEPRSPTSTADSTPQTERSSQHSQSLSDAELDTEEYDDQHDEMESSIIEESIANKQLPGRVHRKWSLKTPDMRMPEKRSRSPPDDLDDDVQRVAKERNESLSGRHHRKWSLKPNEDDDDRSSGRSPELRRQSSSKRLSQTGRKSYSTSDLENKRTQDSTRSDSVYRKRAERRSARTSRSSSRISDISDASELFTTPPTSPDISPASKCPDSRRDSAGERNHLMETPVSKKTSPANFNTPGGSNVPWKTNPLYDQVPPKSYAKPKSDLDNIKTGLVRNSPFRRSLQVVSKSELNSSPFVRNQPLRRSHQQSVKTEQNVSSESPFTRNSPMRRSLQTQMQSDSRSESPQVSRITPLRTSLRSRENTSPSRKHSTPMGGSDYNPSIGQSCNNQDAAVNASLMKTSTSDDSFIAMDAFPTSAPDNTLIKPSKLRESMRRGQSRRRTVDDNKYNGDRNNNSFDNDPNISPRLLKKSRELNVRRVNPLNTPVSSRDHMNNALNSTRDSMSAFCFPDDSIPDTSITALAEQNGQFNTTTSSINIDDLIDESMPSRSRRRLHKEDISLNISNMEIPSRLDQSTVEVSLTPSPKSQTARIVKLQPSPSESDDTNKVHVKPWQSSEGEPDLDNSSPLTPKDAGDSNVNGCPEDDAEKIENTSMNGSKLQANDIDKSISSQLRKAYFRQVEEIKSLNEQISLKDKRIRQLEEEVRLLRDLHHMDESTC